MKHDVTFLVEELDGLIHVSAACSACKWAGGTVRPAKAGRTSDEIKDHLLRRHEDWRGLQAVQEFEAAYDKLEAADLADLDAVTKDIVVAAVNLATASKQVADDTLSRALFQEALAAKGVVGPWPTARKIVDGVATAVAKGGA